MFTDESGVLPESTINFISPSLIARRLFFYLTRCGHYYCTNKYSFSGNSDIGRLPSRQTFLLFFVRSGKMSLRLNNRQYSASANTVVLIDCRLPHYYRALSKTEFIWIHFDGANSRQFFEYITQLQGQAFSVRNADLTYKMTLDLSLSSGIMEPVRSQMIYALLCHLAIPQMKASPGGGSTVIDSAAIFMNSHLSSQITIEEIASSVGISATHFNRLFRGQTGMTPYQYLLQQRMDQAKSLLLSTDHTIKEIAEAVSYSDESTFSAAFTEKIGVSPRGYRKLSLLCDI